MKLIKIKVRNITCSNCALSIKKHFLKLGINVRVNIASKIVSFYTDKDTIFLIKELKKIGYYGFSNAKLELFEKINLLISLFIALVFIINMFLMFFNVNTMNVITPLVQLILASISLFFCGYKFYISFFHELKTFRFGMNTLVFLGSLFAYALSTYYYFLFTTHGPHEMIFYFEVVGILISFVLLGNYIESSIKRKTNKEIEYLLSNEIDSINLIVDDNIITKNINEIKIDDIILVQSSQKIPLDGIIISGESDINEASLTGEELSVFKKENDHVYAQTINITKPLKIRVTSLYEDSLFQKIINYADELASIEPKTKKIANKIANIFIPTVFIIAALTFIITFFLIKLDLRESLLRSISVIVVSCPCALGLATPISIISATNLALKNSILIKSPDFFENGSNIKYFCFDKTGTITSGEQSVIKYYGDKKYLKIAASIEKIIKHPISDAIINYYNNNDYYNIDSYEILPLIGFKAVINNNIYYIGNETLLNENTINPYNDILVEETNLKIYLISNNEVLCLFILNDLIKEDAFETIKELKKRNIKTILITGDNELRAKNIGNLLGFDEVYAKTLPIDKSNIINKLKENNQNVAYIGDGINDLAAQSAASISFSVFNSNNITKENSTITLMKSDLSLILFSLDLSKKTKINIIQNYIWAFGYNIIMIPLAILGILNPLIAGIGMSISSIIVVLNAFRLKLFKRRKK